MNVRHKWSLDTKAILCDLYGISMEGGMVPTHVTPYRDGELRIGWASWDEGSYESRSIKYAYRDASGKISRGCPELPFDILVDMVIHAYGQGELSADEAARLKRSLSA